MSKRPSPVNKFRPTRDLTNLDPSQLPPTDRQKEKIGIQLDRRKFENGQALEASSAAIGGTFFVGGGTTLIQNLVAGNTALTGSITIPSGTISVSGSPAFGTGVLNLLLIDGGGVFDVDALRPPILVMTHVTTGATISGVGLESVYEVPDASGALIRIGKEVSEITTPTAGAVDSTMAWCVMKGGIEVEVFRARGAVGMPATYATGGSTAQGGGASGMVGGQLWVRADLLVTGASTLSGSTTCNADSITQGNIICSGSIIADGRVRALGIYTPILTPFTRFTPAASGADTAELEVPYHPKDGTTVLNFNTRRISWRCAASGATSGVITIEKSLAVNTGAFVPATVGTLTLAAGNYQVAATSALATLSSGDKIRVFVNTLPAATAWTIHVALESSDAPPT
jgi:hypothetical protein